MYSSRRLGFKVLMTIGLMLAASGSSRATVCIYAATRIDEVDVRVCANHGRWNFATLLYYKGLARLLGEYASERISGSSAKKVVIRVMDPAMNGDPVFSVDQDDGAYKLACRGLVSFRLFAQGLHYLAAGFGPPDFAEPAPPPDEVLLAMFNEKMIAAAGEIDMSFFDGRRVVVLDLGRLRVVYQDDRLFYELDGVTLDLEVHDPLPVDLSDGRFLLASVSAAHVYQDGRLVARREWYRPGSHLRPLCAMEYPGWVNFHHDGGIALSYSRRANTFYEVDVEHDFEVPKSGAMAEYVQCENRTLSRIGFRLLPQ